MRRRGLLALLGVALLGLVAGCSGAGALGGAEGAETVTVAIVSNPQMEDAIKLSPEFEAANPGIRLRFVSLSENEARAKITASVAAGGGQFDVVMIGPYETPQWAKNGWITDLQADADADAGLRRQRPPPADRDALSYQRQPVRGAVLRRVVVPDVPQGPARRRPGSPCPRTHLGPGRRRSPPSSTSTGKDGRHLPARQARLGREPGAARHRDQHLRRPVVRHALASAQLTLAGVRAGRVNFYVNLVRNVRRARGAATTASTSADAVRAGQVGDVVRRHRRGRHRREPKTSHVDGQDRLRPRPGRRRPRPPAGCGPGRSRIPQSVPATPTRPGSSCPGRRRRIHQAGRHTKFGWAAVPPGTRTSTYRSRSTSRLPAAFAADTWHSINAADPTHPTVTRCPTSASSTSASRSSRTSAPGLPADQRARSPARRRVSRCARPVASSYAQDRRAELRSEHGPAGGRRGTAMTGTTVERPATSKPALRSRRRAGSGPPPGSGGRRAAAAAGADLHDRRHPDPVPGDALDYSDALLEPRPPGRSTSSGSSNYKTRLHRPGLPRRRW